MAQRRELKRKAEDAEQYNLETVSNERRAVKLAAKNTSPTRSSTELEFDDEIVPSIEQHSETDAQAAKRKKNRRKTRHGKACTLAQPPGREKSQSQSHSHSQSQEKDAPAWTESSTLSKRARRRNRRFMQRRLRRDTELLELQLQAA